MTRFKSLSLAAFFAILMMAWGPPAGAATCDVPSGSYATIQSAVDTTSCTDIVLAGQKFYESPTITRSLTLRGASSSSTNILDRVQVTGGTVVLQGMTIGRSSHHVSNAYPAALSVSGGAQVSGSDLLVYVALDAPIFLDGFESGDTSQWSAALVK